MNLYEKILAIMEDVQYLAKDDMVSFGTTKYKALSEEKVTSIMRAELLKHKLVIFPVQQEFQRNGQISHVDVTYKLVNVENPEEFELIASCGDGADSQDKGSGKAMTYAFKYMWLRTFALPTGEDPDKISSEELDAKQGSGVPCSDCGREIMATKKRDGSIWAAADVAEYTKRQYGRPLCADCAKAEAKKK